MATQKPELSFVATQKPELDFVAAQKPEGGLKKKKSWGIKKVDSSLVSPHPAVEIPFGRSSAPRG